MMPEIDNHANPTISIESPQPNNGPNTYQMDNQITIPPLKKPQLRTATGRLIVPTNLEIGPPQEATNRIRSDSKPARRMKVISIKGPVTKPAPPDAILDPIPCPIKVGNEIHESQANQCPMRESQIHISSERHAL